MAERYQNRQFPAAAALDRSADQFGDGRSEGDPLAELARLIGQTDPLGPAPPNRGNDYDYDYRDQRSQSSSPESYGENVHDISSAQQPGWVRRANAAQQQAQPQYDYADAAEPGYGRQQFADTQSGYDSKSRFDQGRQDQRGYDDAEYDHVEAEDADYHPDAAYSNNDSYGYHEDEYDDEEYDDEEEGGSRGGAGKWIGVIFILAILGGASGLVAYKWRPAPAPAPAPVFQADTTPIKQQPAADSSPVRVVGQTPVKSDENFAPPPETPVNPEPTADQNPPSAFPEPPPPPPRTVQTTRVQPQPQRTAAAETDNVDPEPASVRNIMRAPPAPAPAPARPPAQQRHGPINLGPNAQQQASAAPAPQSPAPVATAGGSGFLVSISSQDSEAAARESFRVAQTKYAAALGSQKLVVTSTTLPDGRVKYRAAVGPFTTRPDAVSICEGLKAAGGQCFIFASAHR
ncbi:MAG: SPOR domain-containing protein [Alphaproteobacteria bacterium]|nr:SPOR domain-containing protein [Alphaproteobacteria bacterium]